MSFEFSNFVAELCYKKFKDLPKTGKPQIKKEWTLLAAVVINTVDAPDKLKVVSLATGTKCLGFSQYSLKGDLILDSHAEVLARRAFIRYLYYQMKLILEKKQSEVLIFDSSKSKFELKSGVKFHFFISHVPCGDAAIFPQEIPKRSLSPDEVESESNCNVSKKLKTEVSKSGIESNISKENAAINLAAFDIHRTGAKCIESGAQDPKRPGADYHVTGTLRTKPGRGDPTRSMSCSDKIALWNVCGLQGALLSQLLFSPIYIDTLIIGKCPFNKEATKRAVVDRLSTITDLPPSYQLNNPVILQSSLPFEFSKENVAITVKKAVPCSAALIWCDVPNFLNVCVDGKKQGITKKNLQKPSSRIEVCKSKLFEQFLDIVQLIPSKDTRENQENFLKSTYFDAKIAAQSYQSAKQAVFRIFDGWKRNSKELSKFTLSDVYNK